jgi:hypothetical protein
MAQYKCAVIDAGNDQLVHAGARERQDAGRHAWLHDHVTEHREARKSRADAANRALGRAAVGVSRFDDKDVEVCTLQRRIEGIDARELM